MVSPNRIKNHGDNSARKNWCGGGTAKIFQIKKDSNGMLNQQFKYLKMQRGMLAQLEEMGITVNDEISAVCCDVPFGTHTFRNAPENRGASLSVERY